MGGKDAGEHGPPDQHVFGHRAIRQYTDELYGPAAARFVARAADRGAGAHAMVQWVRHVQASWPSLRFGGLQVEAIADGRLAFEVEVFLGRLEKKDLTVELFAEAGRDGRALREPMIEAGVRSSQGPIVYRAVVPGGRPASDYTARMFPSRSGLLLPLECNCITWSR